MSYPPHLLDALGRIHAQAALDRLIRDEIAMQAELEANPRQVGTASSADAEKEVSLDGPAGSESSDNLTRPPPEPRP
jgi:hypothetical protein